MFDMTESLSLRKLSSKANLLLLSVGHVEDAGLEGLSTLLLV
jgi:hypothetical protein